MNEQKWNITWVDPKALTPRPKNRNKHTAEDVDYLAKLISANGWRHPIIVSNQSGWIAAGHLRLLAAKKLKCELVPVHYQDFESSDAEYAFHVSDNASGQWAELDMEGINLDIPELGPFDLGLLGVKGFELNASDKVIEKNPHPCPNCGYTK